MHGLGWDKIWQDYPVTHCWDHPQQGIEEARRQQDEAERNMKLAQRELIRGKGTVDMLEQYGTVTYLQLVKGCSFPRRLYVI